MIFTFLIKGTNRIVSIIKLFLYKIMYLNQIKIGNYFNNIFKGKTEIHIFDRTSSLSLGENNIIIGPCWLLTSGNGVIAIGNNNFFNHNISITAKSNIIIGNGCMFGNNVVILDHDHDYREGIEKMKYIEKPVVIEDNCWIGANVTITKGVHIGNRAVVAANSVVTKSIPSNEVWGGVPANKIKKI